MAAKNGIDFTELMTSGKYSDLTLACQGREFKIHRLVACSQSPVIATALNGDFKEAQSGVITIELFDEETVRRLVEYLYTGDYDQIKKPKNAPPDTTPSTSPSATVESQNSSSPAARAPSTPAKRVTKDTLHHVQVNAIADYYGIQGLGLLANHKIQRAYLTSWDPNSFVASVKEALNVSGDESLHRLMAFQAARKLKELLKSGQLPGLVGDFAASVLSCHALLVDESRQEQSQIALQQQQHEQQRAELDAQINNLQTRCQVAEARATRNIENVGKLVSLTNNQVSCRNVSCAKTFGSYLEATGNPTEPAYVLRCSWCRCRHITN
ncbi:hypothetical protein ACQKWADRAFT_294510 [Trichoderma austrokoningii]